MYDNVENSCITRVTTATNLSNSHGEVKAARMDPLFEGEPAGNRVFVGERAIYFVSLYSCDVTCDITL